MRIDAKTPEEENAHLAAILKIMHDEDLLRFRRRLEMAGCLQTSELLTLEIEKRHGDQGEP